MNKQIKYGFLLLLIWVASPALSQPVSQAGTISGITELFKAQQPLPLKLRYSIRDLKKETNDSTYVPTELSFREADGTWRTIEAKIRTRGNYRLKNCYFPPVKLKIRKSVAEGTLFEGNKKLKLVVPCLLQKRKNDLILKEYLAYKLFETVSAYHFKTRLVEVHFEELRGNNQRDHQLMGILIEDIDNVADRHQGNELKRSVHPLQQDNICCVKNDFFQFMIGNTDFSIAYQHNEKLLFIGTKTIPIPYDFDMSGLVDASYAVVSQVQEEKLAITDVTQRLFRGFKRNPAVYQEIREEYLSHKAGMMEVIDAHQPLFEDPAEFESARAFILGFFDVLESDTAFSREILAQSRVK